MTQCINGCRKLKWVCEDCGRIAERAEFPKDEWNRLPKGNKDVLFLSKDGEIRKGLLFEGEVYVTCSEVESDSEKALEFCKAATHWAELREWISTADRLPPQDIRVLVCDAHKWIWTAVYENGLWTTTAGDEPGCEITHWQRLPEPPK